MDPVSNVVRPAMVLEHGGWCLCDLLQMHMVAVEEAETSSTATPTLIPFTNAHKLNYLQQMTYAVQHLHDVADVCHRDIKPDNVTIDNHGVVRLIDFGLARPLHDDKGTPNKFNDRVGTGVFAAPEVMRRDVYDGRMADAWSLAVTAFALTFHFLPVDVADLSDWRFRQLSHYQTASPGPGTVAHILGWYEREEQLKTTCARTVKFIDALLVVEPSRRSPVLLSMLVS
jgi:serine/threonine protein kinase